MIPTQYSLFAGAAHDPRARLAAGLGEYDEMVSGDGRIRAHWRPLVGALQTIPEGILSERVERIYRQYQDTALAFSVENDRQTTEIRRPFDVVPLILPEEEWAALEAGLAQRALLHDNPRFLRPCTARAGMPELRHLHAYCADIVRGPDGAWRVLADRLQAPAGIGFALQNRSILARTLPELFRAQP